MQHVREILDSGTEINSTGREGETALHMAAALGDVELVRLLCGYHADVSALTEDYLTPLLHCARFCGFPDAALPVLIAIDHGADPRTAQENARYCTVP
jgi:ankyrin repeat protein